MSDISPLSRDAQAEKIRKVFYMEAGDTGTRFFNKLVSFDNFDLKFTLVAYLILTRFHWKCTVTNLSGQAARTVKEATGIPYYPCRDDGKARVLRSPQNGAMLEFVANSEIDQDARNENEAAVDYYICKWFAVADMLSYACNSALEGSTSGYRGELHYVLDAVIGRFEDYALAHDSGHGWYGIIYTSNKPEDLHEMYNKFTAMAVRRLEQVKFGNVPEWTEDTDPNNIDYQSIKITDPHEKNIADDLRDRLTGDNVVALFDNVAPDQPCFEPLFDVPPLTPNIGKICDDFWEPLRAYCADESGSVSFDGLDTSHQRSFQSLAGSGAPRPPPRGASLLGTDGNHEVAAVIPVKVMEGSAGKALPRKLDVNELLKTWGAQTA